MNGTRASRAVGSRPRPGVAGRFLAAALISGCASVPVPGPDPDAELREAVRSRGLDPAEIVFPAELGDEPKLWARQQVRADDPAPRKLQALLHALTGSGGLGIRYERDFTGTAQEVFERRRGNCLGFTHLFVALARDLGVPAYYVSLSEAPAVEKEGSLVVVWEHVSAAFGEGSEQRLLQFSFGPQQRWVGLERISDLTALAMHYSNRGAEMLRLEDPAEAVEWLETAVRLDPRWPHGWLNLGVALRRTGDAGGAERAYRRAIEVDPDQLQAYGNLAALLRWRGERDAAGQLLRLLDRRDNRNPFIYLSLGDDALESGSLAEARHYYRRALQLKGARVESLASMGLWEARAQRPDRARRWLRRAEAIEPGNARVRRLRDELADSATRDEPPAQEPPAGAAASR